MLTRIRTKNGRVDHIAKPQKSDKVWYRTLCTQSGIFDEVTDQDAARPLHAKCREIWNATDGNIVIDEAGEPIILTEIKHQRLPAETVREQAAAYGANTDDHHRHNRPASHQPNRAVRRLKGGYSGSKRGSLSARARGVQPHWLKDVRGVG